MGQESGGFRSGAVDVRAAQGRADCLRGRAGRGGCRPAVRDGSDWKGRDPAEFIAVYTDWYRKELDKGYPVAWISFEVEEVMAT